MKKKLIKFVLSFTDYDKIKAENKELKKDIYILVEKQGGLDYLTVMSKWKMKILVGKMLWSGEITKCNKFNGFANIIDVEL